MNLALSALPVASHSPSRWPQGHSGARAEAIAAGRALQPPRGVAEAIPTEGVHPGAGAQRARRQVLRAALGAPTSEGVVHETTPDRYPRRLPVHLAGGRRRLGDRQDAPAGAAAWAGQGLRGRQGRASQGGVVAGATGGPGRVDGAYRHVIQVVVVRVLPEAEP